MHTKYAISQSDIVHFFLNFQVQKFPSFSFIVPLFNIKNYSHGVSPSLYLYLPLALFSSNNNCSVIFFFYRSLLFILDLKFLSRSLSLHLSLFLPPSHSIWCSLFLFSLPFSLSLSLLSLSLSLSLSLLSISFLYYISVII